ncbi:chemotaxis protein CheW [Ectopseudomonas composti]|jgi:purine-binding chemotaxis protein CheW|uniref:chemotaxis protein CheW n=1 Tax=Ectopseudomonas composti TaxID=658457 RepID=UPI000773ADDF|nr:chemotaxis protein CheW [Pseudomonas composti]
MTTDLTLLINEEQQRQYLTFRVGQDLYGVATRYVREILEFDQITMVPMMPSLVRGVINLRGAVVPIIDLAERFGHGRTALGARTCIVIVEILDEEETHLMGALVDAVNAVVEVEPGAIRQAPAFGSRIRGEFIEDMARIDEHFLTLLRMEQVLSVAQIAAMAGQPSDTSYLPCDARERAGANK